MLCWVSSELFSAVRDPYAAVRPYSNLESAGSSVVHVMWAPFWLISEAVIALRSGAVVSAAVSTVTLSNAAAPSLELSWLVTARPT